MQEHPKSLVDEFVRELETMVTHLLEDFTQELEQGARLRDQNAIVDAIDGLWDNHIITGIGELIDALKMQGQFPNVDFDELRELGRRQFFSRAYTHFGIESAETDGEVRPVLPATNQVTPQDGIETVLQQLQVLEGKRDYAAMLACGLPWRKRARSGSAVALHELLAPALVRTQGNREVAIAMYEMLNKTSQRDDADDLRERVCATLQVIVDEGGPPAKFARAILQRTFGMRV